MCTGHLHTISLYYQSKQTIFTIKYEYVQHTLVRFLATFKHESTDHLTAAILYTITHNHRLSDIGKEDPPHILSLTEQRRRIYRLAGNQLRVSSGENGRDHVEEVDEG